MSKSGSSTHWHGVIDIGSNSLRLVIYDVSGRALLPHYNEKVMARLGAGLSQTGRLPPEGIEVALRALGRYRAILEGLNVTHVRVVATAAVRMASDGPAFVERVKAETGLEVEVITGEEEARLSALGVSGGIYQATGIVGDLGGSSLELARLENGVVQAGETLSLGPLSMDMKGLGRTGLRKAVRKALTRSDILPGAEGRFYMVGGAWRALAKLHMDISEYPLRQLQAYVLDERAIFEIDKAANRKDPVGLQQLVAASQRRADILPYANLVLKEAFAIGAFKDAMVSAYGVREGVILDELARKSSSPKATDALLEGVALSVRLQDQRREFSEALFNWVSPVVEPRPDLFGERDLDMRLVAAACLLADSGARFHPDTRAELAYNQALNGPYSNVTHSERAFIALAIGHRYSRNIRPSKRSEGLLDKRQIKLAKRLGAAMRLASRFSGRSATVLKQSQLIREDHQITLAVRKSNIALVSTTVERRLRTLANLMDLDANVLDG